MRCALGLLAWLANRSAKAGPQAILWMALLGLSFYRSAAIPFFAIVACSLLARNWQATRERAEGVVESAELVIGDSGVVDLVERRARSAANQVVERTDELTERAKHVAAQVSDRAEEVSGRARHAAANVADKADDARERAKHVAANVAHRADDASERAKIVTREAADLTVATSKDTGAALIWTAAAAGIVFYALIDKDRREQVLKIVDGMVSQAREIIRDIQGYDEEFTQ